MRGCLESEGAGGSGTERTASETVPSHTRRTVLKGVGAIGAGMLAADPGASAAPAARESPSSLPSEEELESFFDERLTDQLAEYDVAGATVSVVADGEIRLAKGYGDADVESGEPVRADETLFRIGSVSKAVTGTAVMDAVERGLVDLDADVDEYLEGFSIPDAGAEPVTLEHLGTHTAGFEEQAIGLFARTESDLRPLDRVVADDPPARVRPPGELASYSNYGFGLAGQAIADAADTRFSDYVRERVFDPLGMDRSTFRQRPPGDLADATAKGYVFQDGEFREQGFEFVPLRPAGSMSATATDMARFMLAHLQGGRLGDTRILDGETVEGMHDARFRNHPALDGVGYGFYEMNRGDVRIVGHGGDTLVFHSLMALFPDHGVGLFVSYNTAGAAKAREELFDEFVEEYVPPGEPEPIEPDGRPHRADELTGTYRTTRISETSYEKLLGVAQTMGVRVEDDGTLVTDPTIPQLDVQRWVEVEPLVFREVDGHERLAFRENDGEITHAFRGSVPVTGYERLSTREEPVVQAGVFAVSLLVLLSGIFGYSAAGLWNRIEGRTAPDDRPRAARWTAGIAGASLLGTLAGLAVAVGTDPLRIVYGMPGWFPLVFALPIVGTIAAVASFGFAGVAWRDEFWGPLRRLHYTLVALAALAFAWLLTYWNLLWTPL